MDNIFYKIKGNLLPKDIMICLKKGINDLEKTIEKRRQSWKYPSTDFNYTHSINSSNFFVTDTSMFNFSSASIVPTNIYGTSSIT